MESFACVDPSMWVYKEMFSSICRGTQGLQLAIVTRQLNYSEVPPKFLLAKPEQSASFRVQNIKSFTLASTRNSLQSCLGAVLQAGETDQVNTFAKLICIEML